MDVVDAATPNDHNLEISMGAGRSILKDCKDESKPAGSSEELLWLVTAIRGRLRGG